MRSPAGRFVAHQEKMVHFSPMKSIHEDCYQLWRMIQRLRVVISNGTFTSEFISAIHALTGDRILVFATPAASLLLEMTSLSVDTYR